MKAPSDYSEWLDDVFDSFEECLSDFKDGKSTVTDLSDLYLLSPNVVAKNRGISDESLIVEMRNLVDENANNDFKIDPDSKKNYLFQYVIAYIHCHIPIGVLTEFEADRVMEYINDEEELFSVSA